MKREEGEFKKKLCTQLDALDAWSKVLHGNLFQAGMPDVHVTSANGANLFVECKFWSNVHPPSDAHAVQKQLDGAQVTVIKHQLWKRNSPCFIASVIGNNLDYAAICYKDQMSIVKWRKWATLLANFKTMEEYVIQYRTL